MIRDFFKGLIFLIPILSLSQQAINLLDDQKYDTVPYFQSVGHGHNSIMPGSVYSSMYNPDGTYQNGFIDSWQTGAFGRSIGEAGLIAYDIDEDGQLEIIAGATAWADFYMNDYWYILEYVPETEMYEIAWAYPEDNSIGDISLFDLLGDGEMKILVSYFYDGIRIFNAKTLELESTIETPNIGINNVFLIDADNDGELDLTLCGSMRIHLYSPEDLTFKREIEYGSHDTKIGNVDADPANEIVMVNGLVLEVGPDTTVIEWVVDQPFNGSTTIELADIDSDGMDELFFGFRRDSIGCYDADIKQKKWVFNADEHPDVHIEVLNMKIADINDDGIDELVYGNHQGGNVYCFSTQDLEVLWQTRERGSGVTNIIKADFDNDGESELMWGRGSKTTGADYLTVRNATTLELEWTSKPFYGQFTSLDVGDLDTDGDNEIIYISRYIPLGCRDPVLHVFDATTHELQFRSEEVFFNCSNSSAFNICKIADVNDDQRNELVFSMRIFDGPMLAIYDGQSLTKIDTFMFQDIDIGAVMFSTIGTGDVDNDGETEIILGSKRLATGPGGIYIYVVNSRTGDIEWVSRHLTTNYWGGIRTLDVGDIDGDGTPEIVALNDSMFVLDGETHEIWVGEYEKCNGLDLYDTDGDGIQDIVIGTSDGQVVIYDGISREEKFVYKSDIPYLSGLRVHESDFLDSPEIILTGAGYFQALTLADTNVYFKSPAYGWSSAPNNSMIVDDYDNDGKTEILTGIGFLVMEWESGQVFIAPDTTTSDTLVDPPVEVPWRFELRPCFPNPFNMSTTIEYDIHRQMNILLQVYDIRGHLVATPINERQNRGYYSVEWSGIDEHGMAVPSGIYICRIVTEDQSEVIKMTLIK